MRFFYHAYICDAPYLSLTPKFNYDTLILLRMLTKSAATAKKGEINT